jgi:large subunit ribosomal protein L17
MRHRIAGKQLSLDTDHRKAMLRNLAAGLFEHGQIETTMQRAKAVQPLVERIITIAKQGTFRARRLIERKLNDRMVHVWVADPNVKDWKKDNQYFDLPDASAIEFNRYGETRKAPRLVQHIMTKIGPMFADRDGGYTRVVKLGKHRLGDGADVVLLQLVGKEEGPELGGGVSRRREQANRRTAFAAKVRKAASGAPSATASASATTQPEEKPE